jgi:hypothetical protein
MQKPYALIAAPLAALIALAACNKEPETIVAGNDDPQAAALNQAAPVAAPPMIQASRTYRCKDNSLVYVDFYTDNTAQVRKDKGASPTILTSAGAGAAYTAEGYSVSGNTAQITYSGPGKSAQSCKA